MLAADLKPFDDFTGLPADRLEALARRARQLRTPPGRWLVRPGRGIAGRLYLIAGRARLIEHGRLSLVGAGSVRARAALYPGASGIASVTEALFLRLDAGAAALLEGSPSDAPAGAAAGPLGLPRVDAEDSWQRRFLSSPLLQRLGPGHWQRILRAMTRREFSAGERIIGQGEPADGCYVLCAGEGEIAVGRPIARLVAGSLFGEDAIVTGGSRNASVTMRTPGAAMRLPVDVFQTWLLDPLVTPVTECGDRRLVRLQTNGGPPGVPLSEIRALASRLAIDQPVAVTGGRWEERLLAAFLLAEQGLEARPLCEEVQAPGP